MADIKGDNGKRRLGQRTSLQTANICPMCERAGWHDPSCIQRLVPVGA